MSWQGFEAMRAGLVARGLLSADLRLTQAGHAHVAALLARLDQSEAGPDLRAAAVRWNTGQRFWKAAA